MSHPAHIKPAHKAIQAYYETLTAYSERHVGHEGAVRSAFQTLLADTAKLHRWLLVPEKRMRVGGKLVIPDGALYDEFNLNRGYWEAKDTDDVLDVEIKKKVDKGYPLTNTIFEDTRRAVLFQGKHKVNEFALANPQGVADLLNQFYDYTQPEHEDFHTAVAEFKERVPDLARGLADKIEAAHTDNAKFQTAFNDFFALCQSALNPNISRAAVDEMLVQHLLTERLIRKIFDNPEFTRRNVIAAEVEKVIDGLVSRSFNRDDFQKSLDRFYLAIENAAHTMPEFSDKQHFLNTIYERFFQGYSVELADTYGIVYTPQQIVDFMCASVAEVLQTEFGKGLGDRDVNFLDPCTGTGNYIVNLLRRIPKRDLGRVYREQLFANEVMLLPYYIAALNIEHAYYELTGEYEPFEGLCFVDTLDLAEAEQRQLSFMTEVNTARVERQKKTPITVVVGNPPYNMGQLNENDNNKNRTYKVIDDRVRQTYAKHSKTTLKTKLYDPYVRFVRWAVDRLAERDGIVCFVTNNSFVDQLAFDGMRKLLMEDFTGIYHLDLHGNVRLNPKLSGTTHNVFGIQVGVGITVAFRKGKRRGQFLNYHRVPENWRREEKLTCLAARQSIGGVQWQRIKPDEQNTWLVAEHAGEFTAFIPIGSKAARSAAAEPKGTIFKAYSPGINTARDSVVYDFHRDVLAGRIQTFCEDYNSEVDRFKRARNVTSTDDFVRYDKVKWSYMLKRKLERGRFAEYEPGRIRQAVYRPFGKRFLYFDDVLIDARGLQVYASPAQPEESENRVIVVSDIGYRAASTSLLIVNCLADMHLCATTDLHQCFPFYTYAEDGTVRRENITDWALKQFREHYGDKKLGKWDIFYYVYGLLHHPGYRERFADNLKRELPRIPFAADFRAFAGAGQELARLHLDYEQLEPYPLKWIETPGVPLSYRVEDKMRLSKDKTQLAVNPSLTLAGIPPEVFQYRLGNRSALDWVIDQYQVKEDKRSGIRADPNRADDAEYIVRLVGQVVRVSVETVRIVAGLPGEYSVVNKVSDILGSDTTKTVKGEVK